MGTGFFAVGYIKSMIEREIDFLREYLQAGPYTMILVNLQQILKIQKRL